MNKNKITFEDFVPSMLTRTKSEFREQTLAKKEKEKKQKLKNVALDLDRKCVRYKK